MEDLIIKVLNDAQFPITSPQILSQIDEINGKKPTRKQVNKILYNGKGNKFQCYDRYNPPSWSITGKFNFGHVVDLSDDKSDN